MRLTVLCALLTVSLATPVRAQYPAPADSVAGPVLEPETDDEANQADDPNRVPYETDSHLGHHVLAFPSTVWNGLTSLFREGVLWAEYSGTIERLQRRYTGPEPPPYGFTPEVTFGGQDEFGAGLSVFYNDLFGTGRRIRLGGRYTIVGTYSVTSRFGDPSLFGSGITYNLDGGYFNDEEQRFYFGGNDAPDDERFDYAFRKVEVNNTFAFPLTGPLSLALDGEYMFMNVRDGDAPFPIETVPGFGKSHLVTGGGNLILDLSQQAGLFAQREFQGTILLASYHYTQDVSGRDFAYHRLAGEVRQFVPLPVLPYDRRLALRLRYEKTHPLQDNLVPFFNESTLGGPHTLRGFDNNRFREEGYVLFNAEYRWPVWDILDGVVFFDSGQVFQRYKEIGLNEFHSNVGAGLRVYGRSGIAGRLEGAYGPDGIRLLAQIGTVF